MLNRASALTTGGTLDNLTLDAAGIVSVDLNRNLPCRIMIILRRFLFHAFTIKKWKLSRIIGRFILSSRCYKVVLLTLLFI